VLLIIPVMFSYRSRLVQTSSKRYGHFELLNTAIQIPVTTATVTRGSGAAHHPRYVLLPFEAGPDVLERYGDVELLNTAIQIPVTTATVTREVRCCQTSPSCSGTVRGWSRRPRSGTGKLGSNTAIQMPATTATVTQGSGATKRPRHVLLPFEASPDVFVTVLASWAAIRRSRCR